ncbi:MAG: UDP-glucose 4-epimerase GalE [Firmicutes bacterium]|nr:UDP-glucose 4-epimerase GalE [Bacillota bacterium]
MNILVAGGAGYIGSHTAAALRRAGHRVVILDNLQTGHAPAAAAVGGAFVEGDIGDGALVRELLSRHQIDVVVHFAANSLVGESMARPEKYWSNNLGNGLRLLEAMREAGVDKIVFSSTAAVYGEPERVPIEEDHPKAPTNTYGMTKLAVEHLLESFDRAYNFRHISLRYFNAAGADPSGENGEDHDPETHLIPIVLQAALARRDRVSIFGNDYPTPDGTCIRDYIHVVDLAAAHVLAVEALAEGRPSAVYNLGNGNGFSVREVIRTAEKVVGRAIPVEETGRREGDPAVLVASSERIRHELGWKPEFAGLETIVATSWRWHKSHPEGFREGES